jgi:hypothetical protein
MRAAARIALAAAFVATGAAAWGGYRQPAFLLHLATAVRLCS